MPLGASRYRIDIANWAEIKFIVIRPVAHVQKISVDTSFIPRPAHAVANIYEAEFFIFG